MPELSPGSEYLVAFLHSAGTASATGMGLVGLSWQEIESWVRCNDLTGIVTPRDLRTLYMLSRVYAGELAKASQKGATAPYVPKLEMEEDTRAIVANKVDDLFASLIASQSRD